MNFNFYLPLAPLFCLIAPSCISFPPPPTSGFDPNPPKDAITGMWTRKHNDMSMTLIDNIIFLPEGTGIQRTNIKSASNLLTDTTSLESTNDQNYHFTWKYNENGWWSTKTTYQSEENRYRITPKTNGERHLYSISKFNGQSIYHKYTKIK